MKQYIITIRLPEFDENFMRLLPKQRKCIDELVAEGTIQSYALSADQEDFWMVVSAEDDFIVEEMIESFPLVDYFLDYEIIPLMFNVQGVKIPTICLN